MAGLLVSGWLIVASSAWAASFDCVHAKGVAEQAICKDDYLSQLDDQLNQSFAQARARAGQHTGALIQDQRNWLAERNEAVLFGSDAADVYKERIDFLEHLFRDAKTSSPLLQAIYDHINAASPSDVKDPQNPPGSDGAVFHWAEERDPDDAKSLPFDLGDLKTNMDAEDGAKTLVFVDALHVGGISIQVGTSHCVDWTLFSWRDRVVHVIHTPIIIEDYCAEGGTIGGLVEYRGRAYALRFDGSASFRGDLEVQPYVKDSWGMPELLEVRYDVQLLPSTSQCALSNCEELKKRADKVVAHYDKSYNLSALMEALSASDQAKFKLLQQEADSTGELTALPNFGERTPYQNYFFTGFGENKAYFPILWHGELLLGRIGNGQGGAHNSLDWVLGIWRWDGHALVPLLGMVTSKERKNILLSAFVSSPYKVSERDDQP
jgi:uncharacterized protein YecT (DUF1311 family)